ncbi:MAG: hypothetical protein QOI50_4710, partial [Pseudonocardiales bacterium]|nr:hypothetical protein [Pseudonocardiales bacterium]
AGVGRRVWWGGAAGLAGVAWRGRMGWPGSAGRASAGGRLGGVAPLTGPVWPVGAVVGPGHGHRSGWPRTWPWSVCVLSRPVGSARSAATAVATAGATAMASGVVMATWWPFVEAAPEVPRRPPRADVRGRPGTRSAPVSRDRAAPGRRLPATVAVGGPSRTAARESGHPGRRPAGAESRAGSAPGWLGDRPRARPSAVSGCSEQGPSPSPVRVRRDQFGHQLPIEVGTRVDLWLSSSQRSAYAGLADRQSRPLCGVCIWVRPPLRVSYRGWCWARSFLGAVVPRGLVAYAANV